MVNRNRLYSFITVITATMVSSSPHTFHVQEYDSPNGHLAPPSIQIYENLEPGMVLSVIASFSTDNGHFHIYDAAGNKLMAINPSMSRSLLSMNSHIGGWGGPLYSMKLPMKADEKFCFHIAYESNGYRLFLKGEDAYYFKHRSQNIAKEFAVDGGKFFLMSFKLNEPKWAIRQTKNAVYTKEFGDDGTDTPYKMQFQTNNQLSSIAITGIINANETCVEFDLMNADGEILFQFNPRFIDNVVALNSYIDGRWGREETSDAMVLQRNQRFTLAIDVEADYYKTYINGEDFVTYKYRKPAHNLNITKLYIPSGIKLFKIIYYNNN